MKLPKFKNIKKISYFENTLVIEANNTQYDIFCANGTVNKDKKGSHFHTIYTDLLLATARCKNEKTREVLKTILKRSI